MCKALLPYKSLLEYIGKVFHVWTQQKYCNEMRKFNFMAFEDEKNSLNASSVELVKFPILKSYLEHWKIDKQKYDAMRPVCGNTEDWISIPNNWFQ